MIGINYRDKKKNAEKFLKKLGDPYDVLLKDDDGTISIKLGAYGVPETFLISKDFKIFERFVGPLNNQNVIKIKKLLKWE